MLACFQVIVFIYPKAVGQRFVFPVGLKIEAIDIPGDSRDVGVRKTINQLHGFLIQLSINCIIFPSQNFFLLFPVISVAGYSSVVLEAVHSAS